MPLTNISSTQVGNNATYNPELQVANKDTDAASGDAETTYQCTNWSNWFGYYKQIPELKTSIDMRAIWVLGRGFKSDSYTKTILDHVSGWGRESFNDILKNMVVTKRICGDAFAEIIRGNDGTLLNLKPLDPGQIKIVVDKKGVIKRYEQVSKTPDGKPIVFKPTEIFHLMNKRVADEIHGTSDVECVEQIILANNESFKIQKQIIRNFARPKMMVAVDSDDTTKIAAFAAKFDQATALGDNLFYPLGTVKPEVLAVPSGSTINITPWREHLTNYFYRVCGIPSIIIGGGGETFTESSAKISYLAFENSVCSEQLEITEQIWNQLYLKIRLEFPASLQNEMISDTKKDGADQQMTATLNPAGVEE